MSVRDGTYKVRFGTPLGEGTGVVILQQGVLRGGDSMMLYLGSYEQAGDSFTAHVKVSTHTSGNGMTSVFGLPNASLTLSGQSFGDAATLSGTASEAPHIGFSASIVRLAD